MELRKVRCKRCKEFYTFNEGLPPEYCPSCMEAREENIKILREAIYANKGICAMELERLTGIPVSFIMEIINDGQIALKKD